MKHHFADLLDRAGDYWTMVPNRDRYAYFADKEIEDKRSVKILTISKDHQYWRQVFDCPFIEELTLHNPSKEQVQAIQELIHLKRLRVSFFRATDIEFIGNLYNLEEVILEYVSGFSDLAPLKRLTKIKSLHFENLRKISNFIGLKGLTSLRYLRIDGTLDWNQPIEDFEFLDGLPNLEVFSLGFIINKSPFPAFLPVLKLKNLKKIHVGRATFPISDYAFLETALPNIEDCSWDLFWDYDGKFDFLGKRSGFINKNSPFVTERCENFKKQYQEMKRQSSLIIDSLNS